MKAVFRKGNVFTVRNIKLRALKPDEILLRVTACGICGTDLHSNPDYEAREQQFGHEIAGVVKAMGSAVAGFKPGQKVMVESSTPCGRCDACRNERQELCANIQSFFCLDSFGFAEEMLVPVATAIPCEDLPPAIATLAEPLGVAIDMVRLADISNDSNVLLMGGGPIGLMALSLVKRKGARRVFFTELPDKTARIRLGKSLGAVYVNPLKTPIESYDFKAGIDRVLVTTPPPTLAGAFRVAVKGGIVAFIGIAHGEGAYCRFNANDFHFKKLQLRASFASPALYTPLALQYLREGVVDGKALISHRFPLSKFQHAMDVARGPQALKVVIIP